MGLGLAAGWPQFWERGDLRGQRPQQLTSGLGSRAALSCWGSGWGSGWGAGWGSGWAGGTAGGDAGSWGWGPGSASSLTSSVVMIRPLYSSRCVVPEAPGRWIKRTGESLVPKTLCRNCPDDDPLAGPILAVAAKAGGALVVVPRRSSRVGAEEEVEGDEAEARIQQDAPASSRANGTAGDSHGRLPASSFPALPGPVSSRPPACQSWLPLQGRGLLGAQEVSSRWGCVLVGSWGEG